MHRLRTYHSPAEALVAATHLWRNAIPSGVLSSRCETSLVPTIDRASHRLGRYEVLIASRSDAPRARALLQELDESPPQFALSWEQTDAAPDLSLLHPDLAPDCPHCGNRLPLDHSSHTCPKCNIEVDAAELIVSRHGPEALEAAYLTVPVLPDDIVQDAPVMCAKCRYLLAGLAQRGLCPECGAGYDKRALIQYWFG